MNPNKIAVSAKHGERVKNQLIKAGVTKYGLLKGEARHLPAIIKEDEHIHGVVYGRTKNGSAMIVATDKRVLYLDHRVLFSKSDELSYEVVSGVSHNEQAGYAGIVLHTRLGDFRLKFVNLTCAKRFVKYIEKRQIVTEHNKKLNEQKKDEILLPHFDIDSNLKQEFSNRARIFLVSHELGVLSTVAPNDVIQGAVVFYATDKNNLIYIVTKTRTNKAQNIIYHPLVAFTIYDSSSMQTLQIEGIARVESDKNITKNVYETILRPRFNGSHAELSPVLHMPSGDYEVIVITTSRYRFANYKNQIT